MHNKRLVIFFIVLIITIGIGSFFVTKYLAARNQDSRQIVFLTNGQIYFGNLGRSTSQFIQLKDVYYPQSGEALRSNGDRKKVTLQKLGDEVYGPESSIFISRDQILYYANMRKNSKINEAINKFIQDKQSQSANATPTPSVTPSPQ